MAIRLLHRRERIILTAIEIIDELGIQGLSTREIAKRQGISEGTLFRHFKTKNDIVLAVLDNFSKYDADIFRSIGMKGLGPKEAIPYVMDVYATYYENYPAITAMTQIYGVLLHEPDLSPKLTSILNNRKDYLKKVIDDCKGAGELKADADSEVLANIITGAFTTLCLAWRLTSCGFSLRQKTSLAVEMMMAAFSPPESKEERA